MILNLHIEADKNHIFEVSSLGPWSDEYLHETLDTQGTSPNRVYPQKNLEFALKHHIKAVVFFSDDSNVDLEWRENQFFPKKGARIYSPGRQDSVLTEAFKFYKKHYKEE